MDGWEWKWSWWQLGMMIEREYFHRRIGRSFVWIVKCVIVIVIAMLRVRLERDVVGRRATEGGVTCYVKMSSHMLHFYCLRQCCGRGIQHNLSFRLSPDDCLPIHAACLPR